MNEEITRKKILVIDDQEEVLEMITRYLKALEIEPITCSDPQQGLDIWKKSDNISGVILDRSMPKMSGDEVLEKMLTFNPATKAVFVTGDIMKINRKALATFAKPVNLLTFRRIVEMLC